jgi:mRNA degradation ribonuclease J1/J2
LPKQEEISLHDEQLTFFNGLNTTGGVQIVYGKNGQGLLFDFGVEHTDLLFPLYMTSYEPVFASPGREARQYLLAGMTAPYFELYRPEQIQGLNSERVMRQWGGSTFPKYDKLSVYISHMHTDHMALLPYAHQELPVYMSHDSRSLYHSMVAAGSFPATAARMIACENLSVVDFGDFTIQVIATDHNATGVSAIIIDSGDFRIAYTGDWRRQGRNPQNIDRFIDICRGKPIDVLITEGTRVQPDPSKVSVQMTEDVLLSRFGELLNDEGLVYVQMSPRDFERMADMMGIAAQKGRKIVMEASHALAWHVANREGLRLLAGHPALGAKIQVVDATIQDGMEVPYEAVSLEHMAEHKSEYLYFFKFPDLAHMIELETLGELQGQSRFIQSDYGVKKDHKDVAKFLRRFGIAGHDLSNGGHAHPTAISDLIERIQPKAVIPLHSKHPRSVDTRGVKAYYPSKGETIAVKSIIESAK